MTLADIIHDIALWLGYPEPVVVPEVPQQMSTARITSAEVNQLLSDAFGVAAQNSDRSYKLVDIEVLKEFLASNPVSEREFVLESHDCDDFSFILMGDVTRWDPDLTFGVIWGWTPKDTFHAWNWCIGTDRRIWFVEPQNDKVFSPDEFWRVTWLVV